MKSDLQLEKEIYEILYDNLSRTCYNEVSEELIKELIICIKDKGSIWGVLNDNLSNVAVDELEYESEGLKELNHLMEI